MDVENTDALSPTDDDLLADFLDWCDDRQSSLATARESNQYLIEGFIAEYSDSAIAASHRDKLQQFLQISKPIAQLATTAVSAWLGNEHMLNALGLPNEVLPREFGDYELLQRIGLGGMGVVYKARQVSLDRLVAVKMLPPGLLQPDRIKRLLEEAHVAGAMNHPGIVSVIDASEYFGQPFYVMELVDGETLAERLARNPLSEQEAVESIDEIAEAVEYAHSRGVLHRDLKPTNVLIDSGGRLRVADFGLARHVDASITGESVAGTPSYMSPEQAAGGTIDQRADVYGLGAVLYELLSERPPHVGDSPLKTLHLVTTEEPVDLRRLRPGVSRDLETVCHRCLSKKASHRYPSVVEFRKELSRIRRNEPVHARPIGGTQRLLRWMQRNPIVAATALIILLSVTAVIGIGAYALRQTRDALVNVQAAERKKDVALIRVSDAEKEQRQLAEALLLAKEESDAALYRSRIARVAQLRTSGDVLSARQLHEQLRDSKAESGVEFALLERMLYPENTTLPDTSIIDVAWSGDGLTFFSISSDGRIAKWSSHGEKLNEIQQDTTLTFIAVHPGGNQIATVDIEGQVSLFDATTLTLQSVVAAPSTRFRQMMWHDDGESLLLLNEIGELCVLRPSTGGYVVANVNQQAASYATISSDGLSVAVALEDGTVAIGDWSQLSQPDRSSTEHDIEFPVFSDSPAWVTGVSWNVENSLLAIIRESGQAEIWRWSGSEMSHVSTTQLPDTASNNWPIDCDWFGSTPLVLLARGQMIAVDGRDGSVLWTHLGLPTTQVRIQPGQPSWLTISRTAGESVVAISRMDRISVGRAIVETDIPIRTITIAGGGQYVIARNVDGEVSSLDLDVASVHSIVESEAGASALAGSSMDSVVIATRGTQIIMLKLPELEEIERASDHSSTIWKLACSHDGSKLLSGDSNGVVNVYSVNPLRLVTSINTHHGDIHGVAFADDGSFAVADASSIVRLYDSESKLLFSREMRNVINAIALGNEQTLYAGDSSGTISVATSNEDKSHTWQAHQGSIWSLLRIGPRLVSAGQDGSIIVWTTEGEYVMTVAQLRTPVWSLAHDNNHRRIYAATADGKVRVWELSE